MAKQGSSVTAYGVDIRDAAAVDAMVADIVRTTPLTDLPDDGKQSPTFRAWRPYGAGGGLSRIAPNDRALPPKPRRSNAAATAIVGQDQAYPPLVRCATYFRV
jgi:hypothetical protein